MRLPTKLTMIFTSRQTSAKRSATCWPTHKVATSNGRAS
jgi:hypothetical protein